MGYKAIDYTATVVGTTNPIASLFQQVNNVLSLELQHVMGFGMPGTDLRLVEPSGTYPDPPVDPLHPDEIVYECMDVFAYRTMSLTWSGDDVTAEDHTYYDAENIAAGRAADAVNNATDTAGKLSYTYSLVVGAEKVPISGAWT